MNCPNCGKPVTGKHRHDGVEYCSWNCVIRMQIKGTSASIRGKLREDPDLIKVLKEHVGK